MYEHRWALMAASLALVSASCQAPRPAEEPRQSEPAESGSTAVLPLKEIMRALEADLTEVAHGIWTEDHQAVRAGAGRIADHPRVTPRQMGAIQTTLADEFPGFVQQDQAVHNTAVQLVEAVDAAQATGDLFRIYLRMQQGCMSCHTAFRARVIEALYPEGGGG